MQSLSIGRIKPEAVIESEALLDYAGQKLEWLKDPAVVFEGSRGEVRGKAFGMPLDLAAELNIADRVLQPKVTKLRIMGIPFPLGIRAAAASNPDFVPWAWAANGCASVIGSVGAVLGAMTWSFSAMLVAAGFIYLAALFGLSRTRLRVG